MKGTIFLLIVFLTVYPFTSFAGMSTENSTDSFYIRQNQKLKRIEIQSKTGEWYIASKEYSGKNDDFMSRISIRIQKGKICILSVSGDEITCFNAGLHSSTSAFFDLIMEWEKNNLYIWGEKVGGKDTITNCQKIMISYERLKSKDENHRIFRAIVILRNFANKIQIKDVRASECDTCWCHVHRLTSDEY